MYLVEKVIFLVVWIFCFISLCFIPKQNYREVSFIFLFAQLPSWIFGLLVVENGWLEYPVRELAKANATSFTFEFLVLPIMCIYFNLYYPSRKSIYRKLIYYLGFLGIFTLLEYCIERYTLIINYVHWEWYITFITMGVFIYFVRTVYKWFFDIERPF